MRAALAFVCLLTLAATAYLSVSVLILRPPRLNYPVWFTLASIFLAADVATLVLLAIGPVKTAAPRYSMTALAVALAAIGVWMVYGTLTSAHFEGCALVLGSALAVQGALTVGAFLARRDFRIA